MAELGLGKSKDLLVKLFDDQMRILLERSLVLDIREVFRHQRDEVLQTAADMFIPTGHIPFVPVIPRSMTSLDSLMKKVRHYYGAMRYCAEGYNELNKSLLNDVINAPDKLYFVFDVESGRDTLGKSAQEAEDLIKGQGRFCLNVDQTIALCTYMNFLSKGQFMYCMGSRYINTETTPFISLLKNQPRLSWGSIHYQSAKFGTPSFYSSRTFSTVQNK